MSASAVIDSLEFASAEQELVGQVPIKSLKRLEDVLVDRAGSISFELHGSHDDRHRPLLKLHVWGMLQLCCQRCLERLDYPLDFATVLLVVPKGTRPTDAEDATAPDYLEAETEFDVAGLVEDELLLNLPFALLHDYACEERLSRHTKEERASPFASLAALKNSRKP
jgi:DUF177 domain-containing protein